MSPALLFARRPQNPGDWVVFAAIFAIVVAVFGLTALWNRARRRKIIAAAEKLGLTDAQRLIRESANAARNLARHALRALVDTLGHEGYSVTGVGIALSSGRTLGALAATLASHAMIHTAEGELFRNALIAASEQCQLPVTRVRERDLFAHASNQLGTPADKLRAWLADLGRPLGPPWRVDEKISALLGWLVLAQP